MQIEVVFLLVRATPATPVELATLADHARRHDTSASLLGYDLSAATEPREDGIIAAGRYSTWYEPDDPEIRRLLGALTELRGPIDGAALQVWDDLELIGWDASQGAYDLLGDSDFTRLSFPSPGPGLLALGDLPSDHDFGPSAWAGGRAEPAPEPPIGHPDAQGHSLAFVEAPALTAVTDVFLRRIRVDGWLRNTSGAPIRLEVLELTLRDDGGAVIDHDEVHLDHVVNDVHRVACTVDLQAGAVSGAALVELSGSVRGAIHQPLVNLVVAPIEFEGGPEVRRHRLAMAGDDLEGGISLTGVVSGFSGYDYGPYVLFFVEVSDATSGRRSHLDIDLVLQDRDGRSLVSGSASLVHEPGVPPQIASIRIDCPFEIARRIARAELLCRGVYYQRMRLGAYCYAPVEDS